MLFHVEVPRWNRQSVPFFKTFDQQDLVGSLQKQTKVAKKLQKYFHDSSNFAFCRVFLPGCIAVTNTPRSSPLSPIIKHYQPQQCVPFLHKKQGDSNKKMRCNSFSKNKRICFSLSFAVSLVCMTNAFRFHFVQAVLPDLLQFAFNPYS